MIKDEKFQRNLSVPLRGLEPGPHIWSRQGDHCTYHHLAFSSDLILNHI